MFMPDALPLNPADALAPNLAPNLAPSTQRRIRVLDEVIDRTANLMRLIEHQSEQQSKAAQLNAEQPRDIRVSLPWPLISNDVAGAFEKLGRSIRHTVALAEKLEHPPAAAPQSGARKPAQPDILTEQDLARMRDAELDDRLQTAERESERENAENYDAQEEERRFRPFAETVNEIYRNLALPPLLKSNDWRQRFLTQLEAIFKFAAKHKATASAASDPPAPEPTPINPSTAPPDD
jgi:hypothetical protein